jgi:hypothetical protein
MKRWAALSWVVLFAACAPRPQASSRVYHPDHKFPAFNGALARAAFAPLPLGSVKPRGWLRDQLQIQADGLSGHIEEVWPDLGPDNGWRGGRGESWERGPYYLDGLIPMAFLLDDAALQAKMQVWMDWNLSHQHQDGSFGPARGQDWWPDMVFLKALLQYEEASGDERVAPFLERYFAHLKAELPQRRLDSWRKTRSDEEKRLGEDRVSYLDRWQYYRWTEMVLSLLWQYRRTGSPELLVLAQELKKEGFDWGKNFRDMPYKKKSRRDQVFLSNHGVNNAMGMKANALAWLLEGKPAQRSTATQPLEALNRWHGQANGAFAADEELAGSDPSQGTELCTVVEEMYSLEAMLWASGDPALGDALERLAFNALPATFSGDCWRHQYDQQVNQIEVSEAERAWSNNGPRSNIFGLEPQWGCCTANFHQGWPKLVEHLWMASPDGGLALMSYGPSHLELDLPSGNKVQAEVTGSYPFDGKISVKLELQRSEAFPLRLRIPAWVTGASVTVGEQEQHPVAGRFLELKRTWNSGDSVEIHFVMPARAQAWGAGTIVMRGPLLFALPIAAREVTRGGQHWSDQELFATEPWNLAPLLKPGAEIPAAQIDRRPALAQAFDPKDPPLKLRVTAKVVSNWVRQDNSAGPLPAQAQLEGAESSAILVPYGAAKLRVSVFPRIPGEHL